jgi:hypothetical protein
MWVHGHGDSRFDYRILDTRVVCDRRGYPGENPQFENAFLIEI